MAMRGHHPIEIGDLSETKFLAAKLTGGGAATDCTVASGNDVLTAVYASATGKFTLTFKHKYPQAIMPFKPGLVGTTTGLTGTFTAWDPQAGTATLQLDVGGVATDPATTDHIYLMFAVRNSSANPSTW